MQQSGVRKAPLSRQEMVFFRLCCPLGKRNGGRQKGYAIDYRGRIFYEGAWRRIASAVRRKIQRAISDRERWRTDERFRRRKIGDSRARAARENARKRDHYCALTPEQRTEINRARHKRRMRDPEHCARQRAQYRARGGAGLRNIAAGRDRRNPARLINRAVADVRAGKLRANELGRRLDQALALTDEALDVRSRVPAAQQGSGGRRRQGGDHPHETRMRDGHVDGATSNNKDRRRKAVY